MSIFKLLSFGLEDIVFIIIFGLVLFFFLREFKLTSGRGWAILIGLVALGGFVFWSKWRRAKLLQELEEREKKLKATEANYKLLKDQAKLTEEAYNKAKEDLDRTRKESVIAIARADNNLNQTINEIEDKYKSMSTEDAVADMKSLLKGN